MCETVYHNITRHVTRLVGTSGHTKARLETVVCEPSVREPFAFGAPISQTISTSEAFVRGNDWTSTGSSLVMLGHLARTTSALAGPWCANFSSLGTCLCIWEHLSHTLSTPTMPWCVRMPGPASALALCCWGHIAGTTSAPSRPWSAKVPPTAYAHACNDGRTCLAHHRHQYGLGASRCLDLYRPMRIVFGGTWLA